MILPIKKANKAEILAALYNNSKPFGLGELQFDPTPMTTEQAATIIKNDGADSDLMHANTGMKFDYVKGRNMKVDLSKDTFNTGAYDYSYGEGAALRVLSGVAGVFEVTGK